MDKFMNICNTNIQYSYFYLLLFFPFTQKWLQPKRKSDQSESNKCSIYDKSVYI